MLENGLKVIVKPDKRAPIVVAQIWYKVGSSYEHNGITGVSHALEHMMFKGTKTLGPNEVFGVDWFPIELIHPLAVGKSVRVTQYIPLYIEQYDMDKKTVKLIPDAFR